MKNTIDTSRDTGMLGSEAQTLVTATADLAGKAVDEAGRQINTAAARGKELFDKAKEKAVDGARAGDRFIHAHAYEEIAVALGLGALIGYLVSRRFFRCACAG